MTNPEIECPDCGGMGFTVITVPACCMGSDWECGGRGCTGPIQDQEQEGCAACQAIGYRPMTDDERDERAEREDMERNGHNG